MRNYGPLIQAITQSKNGSWGSHLRHVTFRRWKALKCTSLKCKPGIEKNAHTRHQPEAVKMSLTHFLHGETQTKRRVSPHSARESGAQILKGTHISPLIIETQLTSRYAAIKPYYLSRIEMSWQLLLELWLFNCRVNHGIPFYKRMFTDSILIGENDNVHMSNL